MAKVPQEALDAYDYAINKIKENIDERRPEEYQSIDQDAIYNIFIEYMSDEGFTEAEANLYWNSPEIQYQMLNDF